MPSDLPSIKEAVLAILNASPALAAVKVTEAKEPERAKEYVWLYRVKSTRDWASLGRQSKDEVAKVFLRVVAILGGKDGTASEARAFEIVSTVEAALEADVTLGGVVRFHLIEDIEAEKQLFDNKWGAHVLLTISANARIT